ncbi:MAG: translation elongation factor Ts [Arsenophonus endosymbiont of Ceratovacuna japonica]
MTKITSSLVKELRQRTGIGIMECKKILVASNGDIELAIDNIRKLGKAKAIKRANFITAEGIIMEKVSDDGKYGALIELNCETDFVSKDINFITFCKKILQSIVLNKLSNINELNSKFEDQRKIMITKFGENINIRRLKILKGEKIGYYLHGTRIGVLVSYKGADDEFIKHIAMHIAASKPEYITPSDVPSDVITREYQIQLDIAKKYGKSSEIIEKIVIGRMNKFINEISLTSQKFIMDQDKTVGMLLKEKNMIIINFVRFEVGEGIKKIETDFATEVALISK